MKVGIFTPRSLSPLHPRLRFFKQHFHEKGCQVDLINESNYSPNLVSRVSWLVLWFFDLYAILRCKKKVTDYDIVLVNDLKYLPLARIAKRLGKIVIYDTIDHNVSLRLYQLLKKMPLLRPFKKVISNTFVVIEKRIAFTCCDEVLVNSRALQKYFENRATIIHYSSPFEEISFNNNLSLPAALLYLGAFRYDKGAKDIIALQQQLNVPLFIFGPVEDDRLLTEIVQLKDVKYRKKMPVEQLQIELLALSETHFLFGFSLIKPAHLSYEIQEANKDIDYLSLGIPLIGNYRIPTREKIEVGCGLFFDDALLSAKIADSELREQLAVTSELYYREHYHSNKARENLKHITDKYL